MSPKDKISADPSVVKDVVEQKMQRVESIAVNELEPISARAECYKEIIESAKAGMSKYYEEFPQRALDDRAGDAENTSLAGIKSILDILNKYHITKR